MAYSNTRTNRVFGGMYSLNVRVRTTNRTLGTTPGDHELLDTYIASKAPDAISKAEELANTYVPEPGVKAIPQEEKERMITVFPMGKFLQVVDDPGVFYDPLYDTVPEGTEVKKVIVPFIWDYQLRGSFKESIAFIQRASKPKGAKKASGRKKKTDPTPEDEAAQLVEETIAAGGKFKCTGITAYKKVVDGGWFIKQRRIPMLVPEFWIDDLGNEHKTYTEEGLLPIVTRPLRADTAQGPRVCLATSQYVPAGTEYFFTVQLLNANDKEAMLETLDFKERVGMLQWRGGGNGTFVWSPADDLGHAIDVEV